MRLNRRHQMRLNHRRQNTYKGTRILPTGLYYSQLTLLSTNVLHTHSNHCWVTLDSKPLNAINVWQQWLYFTTKSTYNGIPIRLEVICTYALIKTPMYKPTV